MWTIDSGRTERNCEGTNRRDFLKLGSLAATSFTLPHLLAVRAHAAQQGLATKDTSVVWLWLGGGPTHIETFDPKLSAPSEYRSTTGEVETTVPGITLGGTFPKLAQQMHRLAVVRSFAHTNSGHGGGTHFVMTGYDNKTIDNGGLPTRPSMGSIASRLRGATNEHSGMPSYIRLGGIGADGPAFLGAAYSPLDPNGQARRNMEFKVATLGDRHELLQSLDRFRRDADQNGLMTGLDAFEEQAFNLLAGSATKAFDLTKEDKPTLDKYGKDQLAQQMLLSRRLVEAGCGFVTLSYGGWDMHSTVERSMKQRAPAVDHAVATFLEDVWYRGLHEKILLVVTGEFGRTPRINRNAGRDHWAPLSTLAIAGGGFRMGQAVGESMPKADVPKTKPIRPQDLMATVFHHLGIDLKSQVINQAGRPVYLLEDGQPIAELV
jgi:hypothetical protein